MKFNVQPFVPVVLGGDITAYSLARSFHQEYGIKTVSVNMSKSGVTLHSDIIDNIYVENLEDGAVVTDALIEVAGRFPGKKPVLFGCGDWYVRAIIESRAALEPYYIIPYPSEDVMNQVVLKDKFYGYCDELGIDYPKTYVYTVGEELPEKFDFDFPVIAKPANSALYHYAKFPGKKKVFRFGTREELWNMLQKLPGAGYNYKFLIQDFIPGDDVNMRILTCYCDKNAKVRFTSFGHTLLEEHTPSAIGNPVAIINEVNPEVAEAARRFLEHVGYVGYANFDIKYDPRDGKYKFFEINIRLGRSNFYITASGFNNVKPIVDEYVFGNELVDTVADREHLYRVVPNYVIRRYIRDPEQRERALRLIREGRSTHPLLYPADRNLRRRLFVYASYFNQIRKFRRYC